MTSKEIKELVRQRLNEPVPVKPQNKPHPNQQKPRRTCGECTYCHKLENLRRYRRGEECICGKCTWCRSRANRDRKYIEPGFTPPPKTPEVKLPYVEPVKRGGGPGLHGDLRYIWRWTGRLLEQCTELMLEGYGIVPEARQFDFLESPGRRRTDGV